MRVRKRISRNIPETARPDLDQQVEEAEHSLDNSLDFLNNLPKGDEEVRRRAEEIAFTYERELDRLRSRKSSPSLPER